MWAKSERKSNLTFPIVDLAISYCLINNTFK